jgi:hypothetical protein
MLALVVTACLASNPAACGDQILAWMPYESKSSCVLNSRQRMAAWAREHEELMVKGYTCMAGRHGTSPRSATVLAASHMAIN